MDALVAGAEAFIQVFRTAADVFVGFTTGIIPIVVVFLCSSPIYLASFCSSIYAY